MALDRQGLLQIGVGKNGGKVEATFQVASNKGWLEIAKTLNIYISAPRAAREDLRPVLECSIYSLYILYIFSIYSVNSPKDE